MCVLSVFHLVRYKDDKMHAKYPIWGNKTILPETCHLGVFFFYIKTLIRMENTIHGKIKHYQKRVFCVFLSLLRTKSLKRSKTIFMEEQNITKTGVLSVFELERYQNAKMHANYPIFWNKTILTEKFIKSVFWACYLPKR